MPDINQRFKHMQASFRRIPQDLSSMVSPEFNQQLAEYLRNPPPVPPGNNQWAANVHKMLPDPKDPRQGLLQAYIQANTRHP